MYIISRLILIVKNYFRQAQKNPTKRITCWAQKVDLRILDSTTLFDVLVFMFRLVSSSEYVWWLNIVYIAIPLWLILIRLVYFRHRPTVKLNSLGSFTRYLRGLWVSFLSNIAGRLEGLLLVRYLVTLCTRPLNLRARMS